MGNPIYKMALPGGSNYMFGKMNLLSILSNAIHSGFHLKIVKLSLGLNPMSSLSAIMEASYTYPPPCLLTSYRITLYDNY